MKKKKFSYAKVIFCRDNVLDIVRGLDDYVICKI
jgi:hypothetical protein